MNSNPRVAAAVLCATAVLHVLLWWLLTAPSPPKAAAPAPLRVTIVRLPPRPVTATAEPVRSALPPPRERPRDGARAAVPSSPSGEPARQAAVAPGASITSPVDATARPAGAIASAPATAAAPPSLLDSVATRRAVRDAARQRPMSELGDDPSRPDRQLGNAIAGAAKGDCLKGEFAGGGMGLLSLPFWALAQLREQCSK